MAGDWIKIEMETPDKPEVVNMSSRLRIDQDAVTGKLVRIWTWADRNSVNGEHMQINDAFINRLTNKSGFAAAMRDVGWLSGEDGDLTFSNFSRHNGNTAKKRSETNRRVTEHRNCNAKSVTKSVTEVLQKALPEKRREEKSKEEESLPLPFSSEKFKEAWQRWEKFRKESKKKLTPSTVVLQLRDFEKWGEEQSIKAIDCSIKAGWQGLFEPKPDLQKPGAAAGMGLGRNFTSDQLGI